MQVIKKPDSATNTEIAHGPSHGAPQWDRITLRKATARSPCKDEISFLSVTVSSVLPKIAAAVFFTSVISIKKAACSVKKYAERVFRPSDRRLRSAVNGSGQLCRPGVYAIYEDPFAPKGVE